MCFYFLGFLRLLSDPPISISPLNQPTLNKKKKKEEAEDEEKAAGGGAGGSCSEDVSVFLKTLKYLQSLQRGKEKACPPLQPPVSLLQDTPKPSFLWKVSSPLC